MSKKPLIINSSLKLKIIKPQKVRTGDFNFSYWQINFIALIKPKTEV